ncbi:hypothetical protein P9112_004113 [Eukaryota sp. TZLM1-RC]
MFGSDHSPRTDPSNMLELIKSANVNIPFVKDLEAKLERISKKKKEAELRQTQQLPEVNKHRNPFNNGDLVLGLRTNIFYSAFLPECPQDRSPVTTWQNSLVPYRNSFNILLND